MRIRFKPWAREELETSPIYIDNPQEYKNKWKNVFEKQAPIHVELGCGKGSFISKLSKANQEKNVNYIAIDLVDAMLGLAKRNLELEYGIRTTLEKEDIDEWLFSKKSACKLLEKCFEQLHRRKSDTGDYQQLSLFG